MGEKCNIHCYSHFTYDSVFNKCRVRSPYTEECSPIDFQMWISEKNVLTFFADQKFEIL